MFKKPFKLNDILKIPSLLNRIKTKLEKEIYLILNIIYQFQFLIKWQEENYNKYENNTNNINNESDIIILYLYLYLIYYILVEIVVWIYIDLEYFFLSLINVFSESVLLISFSTLSKL